MLIYCTSRTCQDQGVYL